MQDVALVAYGFEGTFVDIDDIFVVAYAVNIYDVTFEQDKCLSGAGVEQYLPVGIYDDIGLAGGSWLHQNRVMY